MGGRGLVAGGLTLGTRAWPDRPPSVPQDTKVNAVVIPETELKAQDLDKDDVLFYTLQEVTPVSAPSPPLWVSPPLRVLPGSQAESPTSLGCQRLLLFGGCEPPRAAAGPVTGLRQVAEHDLPTAGPGEQATPALIPNAHGPTRAAPATGPQA